METSRALSSRAFDNEEARWLAAAIRDAGRGGTLEVARLSDLTVDQVFPLLVDHVGVEIRPGVISATVTGGRVV